MPEQPPSGAPDDPVVRDRLDELADFLDDAPRIDPDLRDRLLHLVDELEGELDQHVLSPAAQAQLSAVLADLLQALRQEKPGPIKATRLRVERAVAQAEAEHPVVTGFLERLLDALSNIGI